MAENAATETGLVIPVPAMEDFVGEWRPLTHEIPVIGVPADVTVLYPWIPPPVAVGDLSKLEAVLSQVEPFTFRLTDVRWFDEEVVYVTPDSG